MSDCVGCRNAPPTPKFSLAAAALPLMFALSQSAPGQEPSWAPSAEMPGPSPASEEQGRAGLGTTATEALLAQLSRISEAVRDP